MKNYTKSRNFSPKLFCSVLNDSNVVRIGPLDSRRVKRDRTEMKEKASGRWTKKEHTAFIKGRYNLFLGLVKYGKEWKRLKECVPSRTMIQVRTHAQKFFLKLSHSLPKRTDPIQYLRTMSTESFYDLIKGYTDPASRSSDPSLSSHNRCTSVREAVGGSEGEGNRISDCRGICCITP
eukprot:TRINITY_DN12729_c0_g3_i1.p1 TRINITY_DN12729_c0_g3~~TRINITY_DN12729_c0_g3_i1.p1  ORF type:complete len:178 (+),score=9.00 TRINITY_DN12729_c0_g3_i1:218-751(+)